MNNYPVETSTAPDNSPRLFRHWHYLFALVFALLFHFPLLSPEGGMTGEWDDMYTLHATARVICADAVKHGRLPEWTDALFGGFPFYSASETAFFFPSNLVQAFLQYYPDTQDKVDYYVLFHLVLLALASTFLARSFGLSRTGAVVASLISSYNGYVCWHIGHVNLYQTIEFGMIAAGLLLRMPLRDGMGAARYAVAAGLCMGAAILPNHSQTVMQLYYALGFGTVLGALVVLLTRRSWRPSLRLLLFFTLAVIIAFATAAVQLLPNIKLTMVSERMDLSRAAASAHGGDIRQLAAFIFPGFYRTLSWDLSAPWFYRNYGLQWLGSVPYERFYWFGLTAFVLGIAGYVGNFRRPLIQVLFWSSLFLLASSFSEQPTLYWFLYHVLPGVSITRIPTRLLWIFFTLWGMLAGFGVDALLARRYDWTRTAKRVLALVAGGLLIAGAVFLTVRVLSDSWWQTYMRLFVLEDEPRLYTLMVDNAGLFFDSINKQLLLAAVILSFVVLSIAVSGFARSQAMRVFARGLLIGVLSLELFLYGFSTNYLPVHSHHGSDFPPIAFIALGTNRQLDGRLLTLPPAFRTGGINMAAVTGPKLASGYCATVPHWLSEMSPYPIPPWRVPLDDVLMDLWSVSDIIIPSTVRRIEFGGRSTTLRDAGGALLQVGGPAAGMHHPPVTVLNTYTTEPLRAVHFIGGTSGSIEMKDGPKVGTVDILTTEGITASYDLILGKNICDINYDMLPPTSSPAHSRTETAFAQNVNAVFEFAPLRNISKASLQLDPPVTATQIRVTAVNERAEIYLSHVVVETSSSNRALRPRISRRFYDVHSQDPKWRLLHRDGTPPLARMMPTARPSSYRRINNVTRRLTAPGFRLDRELLVNRDNFSTHVLNGLNAPDPVNFNGTAELVPSENPAKVSIGTRSNQRGWLFLSQTWYDGWTATIDGKPAEVVRVNGAFQGLPVPEGEHQIEMSFRTPGLATGGWLSGIVVAGSLLYLLFGPRGRRRPPNPAFQPE